MKRTHIFTVDIPKSFFDVISVPAWKRDLYIGGICANVVQSSIKSIEGFARVKKAKVTAHESDTLYLFRCSVRTELPEPVCRKAVSEVIKKHLAHEVKQFIEEKV